MIEIVRATEQHAIAMGPNVREVDRAEVWAMRHIDPTDALLDCLGPHAYTALDDGTPIAMFGVLESGSILGSEYAVPWLLGTDALDYRGLTIVRLSKVYMAVWKLRYKGMFNFVDARNTKSVRWLKTLGFTVHPAKPMGKDNLPFHFFDWNNASCAT